ncbi:uncharacterized protein LOC133530424 [Cydia pomonella]|uniref:uncharacterized protein LOC133530424 n=1 Tax=Cydia pomonella TaxID=82600 RepID=UPI002ADDC3BA|nr:uncharacterized protein LOC133530424 [Cydia pomonella]
MELNRRFQTEYLINNILDQDFQAMLFPLNFVQSCFLMPRFSIINNFITPDNHASFYIKSIIGCLILTLSHVFRFIFYNEITKSVSTGVVDFLLYFDFTYFSFTSVIIYIVNSFHRSSVVELIIKLQHVLDVIRIDKQEFLCKHKIQNWLSISLVLIIYVFHWLSACIDFGILDLLVHFCLVIPLMIYDIQVVHVIRSVVMIKNELIAWIHKLEKSKETHIKPKENIVNFEVSESDMFNAYTDIIRAFRLSNKVYQFSVSSSIYAIKLIREYMRIINKIRPCNKTTYYFKQYCTAQYRFKIYSIIARELSTSRRVRNKKVEFRKILQFFFSVDFPGMRKTCKNVLRLNRTSLRKMSAFGVFDVDAAFPLRLLSGLVPYTVVLLQFAFLSP